MLPHSTTIVEVFLWHRVQLVPAEALGAVANQKLIAKAVAIMMPAAVETELNRFLISRMFFIYGKGLSYVFYEIRSR